MTYRSYKGGYVQRYTSFRYILHRRDALSFTGPVTVPARVNHNQHIIFEISRLFSSFERRAVSISQFSRGKDSTLLTPPVRNYVANTEREQAT